MNRNTLLETALKAVTDRPVGYDLPEQNFARIARLWTTHIRNRYRAGAVTVDATDVAIMCALIKIARLEFSPGHVDSWTDLAGYAACGAEVSTEKGEGPLVGPGAKPLSKMTYAEMRAAYPHEYSDESLTHGA